MAMVATADRVRDDHYARELGEGTRVSDDSLKSLDTFGVVVAAIMTLAPLAATALFAH
jgi:hypothetical protein